MCGTACAPSISDRAPAARTLETISATGLIVPSTFETCVKATRRTSPRASSESSACERELAVLVDLQIAELGAALAAEHLPGNDVRVVLHLGDQHGVAGAHIRTAPRVGDEVDRLGDVLGEDRRLRIAVREGGDPGACALKGGVGLGGERVDAAVDVRVVLAQMLGDGVDDDLGLLRGCGRVQVDELAPVEAPAEDREVGPDGERLLSDWWHTPRCPRRPRRASRRPSRG